MSGTGTNGRSRTLADALARHPAPGARACSELTVMEGIAELLGQLSDEAARSRVLQWIDSVYRRNEPAGLETPATAAAAPMSVPTPATVAAAPMSVPTPATVAAAPMSVPTPATVAAAPMSVPTPATVASTPMPAPTAVAPIVEVAWESNRQELSDSDLSFEGLEEWFEQPGASRPAASQSAISETAVSETLVSATGVSQPDVIKPASANPPVAPAATSQPVVSLLHDFVTDFQRLARDWQES